MGTQIRRLSHLGIHTSDLLASTRWYTQVLGLAEAFRLEQNGQPWIVYLHAGGQTFIELYGPADDDSVPHAHFSLEVADVDRAVAELLPRLPEGAVRDSQVVTGADGSRIFNFFDPDGHRIEFQEFPPESRQAKALCRDPGAR